MTMAERLIDAELLKHTTKRLLEEQENYGFYPKSWDEEVIAFKRLIDGMPAIEAKPVVHAHWKKWGCQGTVCSNCHGRVLYECDGQEEKSKFCPHCSATMDENHIAEDGKKEGK